MNIGIEHDVEKNLLLEAVNRLGERERTIMQLRFDQLTETNIHKKEVADMIGIFSPIFHGSKKDHQAVKARFGKINLSQKFHHQSIFPRREGHDIIAEKVRRGL